MEALNAATANIPADRMRLHVCWGNYEGPHDHDIPLEKILAAVLKARPATILFEAANPRHEHEWTVWRDAAIPDDKVLAPGLIDTCSNYVEHPELIAQRLARYVAIVGNDRVVASTDCGFGTFAGYGKIDPDVAWKKLAALSQGAGLAASRAAGRPGLSMRGVRTVARVVHSSPSPSKRRGFAGRGSLRHGPRVTLITAGITLRG